jgi:hypothetical protein
LLELGFALPLFGLGGFPARLGFCFRLSLLKPAFPLEL